MHYVWEDADANIFNITEFSGTEIMHRCGSTLNLDREKQLQSVVPEKTTEGARMHT